MRTATLAILAGTILALAAPTVSDAAMMRHGHSYRMMRHVHSMHMGRSGGRMPGHRTF